MKRLLFYISLGAFILTDIILLGTIVYKAYFEKERSGIQLPNALSTSGQIGILFLEIAGISLLAGVIMLLFHFQK